MKAVLALADGRTFKGTAFGFQGEARGEIVFNTSMTGYQEVITDPSYYGQMVVMTYPLIGNYGINLEDTESECPHLSALIIKELSTIPSNWRSQGTLNDYLQNHGVVGIQGIDTRALTRHIRETGAQQAIVSSISTDQCWLTERANALPGLEGRDLVQDVTCSKSYDWNESVQNLNHDGIDFQVKPDISKKFFVVAYDFGIKRNILRILTKMNCKVKVVPASTPAKNVLALKPDGVFLSNGPGDPAALKYASNNVKLLIGKVPLFGICLGHQILSLAMGAKTSKLRFGHHGGNQPVINLHSKKVEITAQNHGFTVDPDSMSNDCSITSINLNDNTVEGIRHNFFPILSVQYHPEASPGPHDSLYMFQEFIDMMSNHKC